MIHRFQQFSSAIASIYKNIQRIEREEMTALGLKGPHVQCLMVLSQHPGGLASAELCELCEKDKAAISRTVAELEAAGLLLREHTYRAPLVLTDRGHQTADHLETLATRAVEAAGLGVSDHDREIFYAVLSQISCNLQTISSDGIPNKD